MTDVNSFEHYRVRFLYPLAGTIVSVVLFVLYWDFGFNKFLSLFVTLIGLVIWWVATITLGRSFSLIPRARELIQKGIYSKIRHPIYWGASITSVGWVVLTHSLVLVFVAAVFILSSLVRASLEEKKLIETFGGKYISYKKRTWL